MRYIDEGIKIVLFDLDDTLVGTIEAKWAAHKHIAKTLYGKDLVDDEIRQHWGKPLRELVCLLYGDDDAERALAREASVYEIFPKKLFNGTIAVLESLRNAGKKLGVVTAHTRKGLEYDLKSLGISPSFFDYTQTQDDTKYHKPDPRVFEPVLDWIKRGGVNPKEVIYIGDSLHDMKSAIGSGFQFMGVCTGLVNHEEFQKEGVRAIERLSDLLE